MTAFLTVLSRRYEYAYGKEKVAFAWLGSRYLNEIRAGEFRVLQCAHFPLLTLTGAWYMTPCCGRLRQGHRDCWRYGLDIGDCMNVVSERVPNPCVPVYC